MEVLKKYFVVILTVIIVVSCQNREEPLPLIGSPELYLKGTFDDEEFEYIAGEEGYFNEAFTYVDEQGNSWLASSFRDNQNSSFDFEIELLNSTPNTGNNIEIGSYSSQADTIIQQYAVQLRAPEVQGASYGWDLRDGTFLIEKDPVVYFPIEEGAYEVCLNIIYPDSCTAQICQVIKPHLEGKLNIISSSSGLGLTVLSPQIEGFEAISYEWTLSNGQKSQTKDIAIQNNSNVIEACLEVTNRKSEVYERCIQIIPAGLQNVCVSNYDYDISIVTDTLNPIVSKGRFNSTFKLNGTSYSISDFDGNNLEILSSEPYLLNADGEPTQKISFTMDTRLEDENGNLFHLNISEGVIAIGKN